MRPNKINGFIKERKRFFLKIRDLKALLVCLKKTTLYLLKKII